MVRYAEPLVGRQQVDAVEAELCAIWTLTPIEARNEKSVGVFVPGKALLAGGTLLKVPAPCPTCVVRIAV